MTPLALPAPSAARTRRRNADAMLQRLSGLKWTITIHDAPPGARLWLVVMKWQDDTTITTTANINAAITAKQAQELHIQSCHRTNDQVL